MLLLFFLVLAASQAPTNPDESLFGNPMPLVGPPSQAVNSGFLPPAARICNAFAVGADRLMTGFRFAWSCSAAVCAENRLAVAEVWEFPDTFTNNGRASLSTQTFNLVPAADQMASTPYWHEYSLPASLLIQASDFRLVGNRASTMICIGLDASETTNSGYSFVREDLVARVVQSPNGVVAVPCLNADPTTGNNCNRRGATFLPNTQPSFASFAVNSDRRLFYIEPIFATVQGSE